MKSEELHYSQLSDPKARLDCDQKKIRKFLIKK